METDHSRESRLCIVLLNMQKLAELKWTKYLVYNSSKIVELFQGQLKTSLTCGNEECGKVYHVFHYFSIILNMQKIKLKVDRNFDPFMFLTVPLPDNMVSPPSTYDSISIILYTVEPWYGGHSV